jgi:nucleoside-diphosphate-sugar epimerase
MGGSATRAYNIAKGLTINNVKVTVEAINLASERETKVIDLANWINEMTGNRAGIMFKPRRDWDKAIRRRASIEKARRILGYEPKTDIKSGLKKVHEWFKENRDRIGE